MASWGFDRFGVLLPFELSSRSWIGFALTVRKLCHARSFRLSLHFTILDRTFSSTAYHCELLRNSTGSSVLDSMLRGRTGGCLSGATGCREPLELCSSPAFEVGPHVGASWWLWFIPKSRGERHYTLGVELHCNLVPGPIVRRRA